MKLFLIDGHALIFKMYYAFLGRPMINGKGVDTSILFGFTKYLFELIEKEAPTHIAVCFDPPGGTFRNEIYPEYKANRGETPELVIEALEPLSGIVRAMNIPVLMIPGFEADDVICSAARKFASEDVDVYMVTPDKDYGQVVSPHIFQYRPGRSGEAEILSEKEICEKWGIESTSEVIDILALCGDTADNVPGVQGVGPVGASKLLGKYGSIEGIYDHIGELTDRQKAQFEAARDHIWLSKSLVTIKTDIEIPVSLEDMELASPTEDLVPLFDLYEFGSLKRRLPAALPKKKGTEIEYTIVPATEVRSKDITVNLKGDVLYVASGGKIAEGAPEEFRHLLENAEVAKTGADLKPLLKALYAKGITVRGKLRDIELMHYLLDPESSHKTDMLSVRYLGVELDRKDTAGSTLSLFGDAGEESSEDNLRETAAISLLCGLLEKELEANASLRKLYDEVEEPLLRVLADMEMTGVKIDIGSLKEYSDGLRRRMLEKEAEVRSVAGSPAFNVSSPKQVGELIYEKLKLDPSARKPARGGWPTDEQTLLEIADRSPVIDAILEYRGLRKLLSTYIEPIPTYISPVDGRVHTTFNQALTSTGRLSSSNPNLQNIPVRTDDGREIRKAFVPDGPGKVIMSADYSQIELRIMAHLCGDEHLCEAFRNGVDVHSATASRIFGVDVAAVTPEQRRVAKTANFGIMYGISAFGLSQRLKCSRTEAKQIIEDYFTSFPSIRGFIDETLRFARENGYVETIFGRRRYVPDVNSTNGNVRSFAERNAVNAPIQGSAADIMKMAMTGVWRKIAAEGMKSRMVLQIHDEIVMEVPSFEINDMKAVLISEMENVVKLNVPLTVECNYGTSWLAAH